MKALVEHIVTRLAPFYGESEALELAYWVIEETTGLTRFDVRTHKGTKSIPNLEEILQKLCEYVPVQYIFGHTEWLGMDLQVTPATLIPRPETAELVELIGNYKLKNTNYKLVDPPIKILDVGTGSGCIALALKKKHPQWIVEGLDNSREALTVAQSNAKRLGLDVRFFEADILNSATACTSGCMSEHYDIIVSNPPYIRPSERDTMTENTLLHEPQQALYVPEDDPQLFYRCIAQMHKAPELWFEISETQGEAMLALMQQLDYEAVCLTDMYGKQRFIHATTRN